MDIMLFLWKLKSQNVGNLVVWNFMSIPSFLSEHVLSVRLFSIILSSIYICHVALINILVYSVL